MQAKDKAEGGAGDTPVEQGPVFRGSFSHGLDDKGRLSLPAEFRRAVQADGAIVITNYISEGNRCLEGFGVGAWQRFEEKLRAKSRFDAKLQRLENYYLSRAAKCDIDRSGRILLPAYLRSYAGISREATFTASIHGFRLWDTRVWEVVFRDAEAALMENPDLFKGVDL